MVGLFCFVVLCCVLFFPQALILPFLKPKFQHNNEANREDDISCSFRLLRKRVMFSAVCSLSPIKVCVGRGGGGGEGRDQNELLKFSFCLRSNRSKKIKFKNLKRQITLFALVGKKVWKIYSYTQQHKIHINISLSLNALRD